MLHENTYQLISPAQVAEQLGISTKTLAQWRVAGVIELPYAKIGSRVMYRKSDVEQFIERSMRTHTGAVA